MSLLCAVGIITTTPDRATAGPFHQEVLPLAKTMKIMSVLITVILYGRMIEICLYCSVSPIPFATMTNREWGQIGNNYLKALFALGFQGLRNKRKLSAAGMTWI